MKPIEDPTKRPANEQINNVLPPEKLNEQTEVQAAEGAVEESVELDVEEQLASVEDSQIEEGDGQSERRIHTVPIRTVYNVVDKVLSVDEAGGIVDSVAEQLVKQSIKTVFGSGGNSDKESVNPQAEQKPTEVPTEEVVAPIIEENTIDETTEVEEGTTIVETETTEENTVVEEEIIVPVEEVVAPVEEEHIEKLAEEDTVAPEEPVAPAEVPTEEPVAPEEPIEEVVVPEEEPTEDIVAHVEEEPKESGDDKEAVVAPTLTMNKILAKYEQSEKDNKELRKELKGAKRQRRLYKFFAVAFLFVACALIVLMYLAYNKPAEPNEGEDFAKQIEDLEMRIMEQELQITALENQNSELANENTRYDDMVREYEKELSTLRSELGDYKNMAVAIEKEKINDSIIRYKAIDKSTGRVLAIEDENVSITITPKRTYVFSVHRQHVNTNSGSSSIITTVNNK